MIIFVAMNSTLRSPIVSALLYFCASSISPTRLFRANLPLFAHSPSRIPPITSSYLLINFRAHWTSHSSNLSNKLDFRDFLESLSLVPSPDPIPSYLALPIFPFITAQPRLVLLLFPNRAQRRDFVKPQRPDWPIRLSFIFLSRASAWPAPSPPPRFPPSPISSSNITRFGLSSPASRRALHRTIPNSEIFTARFPHSPPTVFVFHFGKPALFA